MQMNSLFNDKKIKIGVVILILVIGIYAFNPDLFTQAAHGDEPVLKSITISNMERAPQEVSIDNSVIVSCEISSTGIDLLTATLYYKIGANEYSMSMNYNNGLYTATIPIQSENTYVEYWVRVVGDITTITVSSIQSYTVVGDIEPLTYSATYTIYNKVEDNWVEVLEGGTLFGTIKIDLQVLQGVSDITSVRISVWKVIDGQWTKQDEQGMAGVEGTTGAFNLEYDTMALENAIYDIRYELIAGDTIVYTQSLFGSDGEPNGVDQTGLFWGIIGIIVVGLLIYVYGKYRK